MSQGIPARYLMAAKLYIFDGMTQGEIADELGVARETVNRWMRSPRWVAAVNESLRRWGANAKAVAYRRLIASASGEPGSPGVTAANSLLARIEGPVAEMVELRHANQDGSGPPVLEIRVVPCADHADNDVPEAAPVPGE